MITPEWLNDRENEIIGEIKRMEGALEMLRIVREQITAPKDALTLDDLKTLTGAQSVGEPEEVK